MKPVKELAKREPGFEALDRPIETPQSYNYGVDPNAENDVHLLDYWRAIRKRLWLVLGIVALVTMLAVVYVARKPDFYEAQARVQVDLEETGTLVNQTRPLYGPADDPIYFNTQLQILVSPGLMRRVVRTLDLEHNPDFFKGNPAQRQSTWQTLRRMAGLGSKPQDNGQKTPDELPLTATVAQATAREDLNEAKRLAPYVNTILSGLKVEPVKENRGYYKETRLIDIQYTHTAPEVTAKVVNAIAETYVFSNLEKRTEANSTTGDFLQKRIAELQQQIRTAEERLVNYAKNNQIISLDPNQNTVVERLAGLNRQLLEAENDRKTAEAALNAAKVPDAAIALADEGAKQTNEIEGKLVDLRQKRAQLLVDATEEAPEVKEVDQQIGELDRQLKDMRSRKSAT
ncbi:MAG TPA: Wzz/FepE/Etk N-terminal domain-containing protein, partial [Pyrinomonadaceae bacterium]|nr:Wzz/FepE/Etk N-terminal domain-containing protein [Pyrinomonadaceae bacterium]